MGKSDDEIAQLANSLDSRKDTYLDALTELAGTEALPPFLHRRNRSREAGGGDVETMIKGVWITCVSHSLDLSRPIRGREEHLPSA